MKGLKILGIGISLFASYFYMTLNSLLGMFIYSVVAIFLFAIFNKWEN